MKRIEVVAAIIHDAEGRIFATQRAAGAEGARGGAVAGEGGAWQRGLVACRQGCR